MSHWTMTKALATLGIVLPPRPQRLALQRRHHAEQQITRRVVQLGFHDLHAYLTDRVLHRQWPQAAVAAELGTHLVRVRDLIGQAGVRRAGPTARQRAVAQRARQVQAAVWQAPRAARVADLGFPDLAAYLECRVGQGWSIRRIRAELAVSRSWLAAEMVRLGYRQ